MVIDNRSIFILLHVDTQLCQHHLLNMLSFSILHFFGFVKNQVFIVVWIDIWVFNSVALVLLSVFMPIPSSFQYFSSVVEFEVRDCDASRSSFIVQDCFGYPGFWLFHIKLSIILSPTSKNFAGVLMGIALNLQIALGKIAIFTILILPTQEHGRYFHFLMSSSISVFSDLKFLSYMSSTCLVGVTPRYFMLFVTIVKGDVYLISLLAHL